VSHDLGIYTPVLKGPESVTRPFNRHNEDQGALQTESPSSQNGNYVTTQQTCPERARRALIRGATKRPKVSLKELHRAASVQRTSVGCSFHRAERHRGEARQNRRFLQ